MPVREFTIDCTLITNWDDFHREFKKVLNFPDYYGCNMDAWIDCMDELTKKPLVLKLKGSEQLKFSKPGIYDVLIEYADFVKYRRTSRGLKPNLTIVFS